jgi:hypothetical protein
MRQCPRPPGLVAALSKDVGQQILGHEFQDVPSMTDVMTDVTDVTATALQHLPQNVRRGVMHLTHSDDSMNLCLRCLHIVYIFSAE